MTATVEREFTTVFVTAHREPDHRSRTERFEIHTKDIGLTIGVTVVWDCFHHHFRPGTAHKDQAVALTKRALCEALDEAVSDGGGMTIAAFNSVFRTVREREGFLPWDGKMIETSDEIGFGN